MTSELPSKPFPQAGRDIDTTTAAVSTDVRMAFSFSSVSSGSTMSANMLMGLPLAVKAELARLRAGGLRAGNPQSNHPFIPVRVTPWMKYFWAKKKMTMTGTVMSRLAAMVSAGLLATWTLKA